MVVVLPSPAGVGLIAVTRISLPFFLSLSVLMYSIDTLALKWPYGSRFSAAMPSFSLATSRMRRGLEAWAISMSDLGDWCCEAGMGAVHQ